MIVAIFDWHFYGLITKRKMKNDNNREVKHSQFASSFCFTSLNVWQEICI